MSAAAAAVLALSSALLVLAAAFFYAAHAAARRCRRCGLPEMECECAPVKVGLDGRCDCDCADICLLGRTGSSPRCTESELQEAGVPTVRREA